MKPGAGIRPPPHSRPIFPKLPVRPAPCGAFFCVGGRSRGRWRQSARAGLTPLARGFHKHGYPPGLEGPGSCFAIGNAETPISFSCWIGGPRTFLAAARRFPAAVHLAHSLAARGPRFFAKKDGYPAPESRCCAEGDLCPSYPPEAVGTALPSKEKRVSARRENCDAVHRFSFFGIPNPDRSISRARRSQSPEACRLRPVIKVNSRNETATLSL